MFRFVEWLLDTLGLGALKVWLTARANTDQQLGRAEQRAADDEAVIHGQAAMAKAVAAAPTSMEQLIEAQREGQE